MKRLDGLLPNSPGPVAAVKAAIRSFRGSESGAKDLISTCWNVLDRDLDRTASIILGVVDLLDNEDKKNHLLAAWNGFKVEVGIHHFKSVLALTISTLATTPVS